MNLNEACERLYNIIKLEEDTKIKDNIQKILIDINSDIYFFDTIILKDIEIQFYTGKFSDDFIFGVDKKILELLWNTDFDGLIDYDIEERLENKIRLDDFVRSINILSDGTLTIFPVDKNESYAMIVHL